VSGEIVEVNARLEKEPQLVNGAPYSDGWMVKVKLSDPSEKKELLKAEDYAAHIGQ
jgi:glycine cleavage system H protein